MSCLTVTLERQGNAEVTLERKGGLTVTIGEVCAVSLSPNTLLLTSDGKPLFTSEDGYIYYTKKEEK